MEIEILERNDVDSTQDLLEWMRSQGLGGVEFTLKSGPLKPDTMGQDLLPIILATMPIVKIVADSKVLVEIVKAVSAWLIAKRQNGAVKLSQKGGASVEINSSSATDAIQIAQELAAAK